MPPTHVVCPVPLCCTFFPRNSCPHVQFAINALSLFLEFVPTCLEAFNAQVLLYGLQDALEIQHLHLP